MIAPREIAPREPNDAPGEAWRSARRPSLHSWWRAKTPALVLFIVCLVAAVTLAESPTLLAAPLTPSVGSGKVTTWTQTIMTHMPAQDCATIEAKFPQSARLAHPCTWTDQLTITIVGAVPPTAALGTLPNVQSGGGGGCAPHSPLYNVILSDTHAPWYQLWVADTEASISGDGCLTPTVNWEKHWVGAEFAGYGVTPNNLWNYGDASWDRVVVSQFWISFPANTGGFTQTTIMTMPVSMWNWSFYDGPQ